MLQMSSRATDFMTKRSSRLAVLQFMYLHSCKEFVSVQPHSHNKHSCVTYVLVTQLQLTLLRDYGYGFWQGLYMGSHGEVYVTLTFALAGSACVCLTHSW